MRFCNISVRPGDHAPFLETHGNSVRLGRSANGSSYHSEEVHLPTGVRSLGHTADSLDHKPDSLGHTAHGEKENRKEIEVG